MIPQLRQYVSRFVNIGTLPFGCDARVSEKVSGGLNTALFHGGLRMWLVQHGLPTTQRDALTRASGLAWFGQCGPERPAQCEEIRPPDISPRGLFKNRNSFRSSAHHRPHVSISEASPSALAA